MKHQLIFATCLTLILALSGCEEQVTNIETYPPTKGNFVENLEGRGVAKVWGINFNVTASMGHSSGYAFEGELHSDPEKTDARVNITLGDDVNIQLEKIPGKPISFKMNGKSYGNLDVGDKVAIDRDRNVKVNETTQKPVQKAV